MYRAVMRTLGPSEFNRIFSGKESPVISKFTSLGDSPDVNYTVEKTRTGQKNPILACFSFQEELTKSRGRQRIFEEEDLGTIVYIQGHSDYNRQKGVWGGLFCAYAGRGSFGGYRFIGHGGEHNYATWKRFMALMAARPFDEVGGLGARSSMNGDYCSVPYVVPDLGKLVSGGRARRRADGGV
jgi:hypothetical protein